VADADDGEDSYDGIPFHDLPIDSIEWEGPAIEHITTRSIRSHPNDLDIEPEWATEAALDPSRLIAWGSSRDKISIQVLGFSPNAPGRGESTGRVLKVWLVPKTHPPDGNWLGRSACSGSKQDRQEYEEADEDD
jgi:hypothetical protein